ncbi:MAG: mechanosensitive ion channel family protein [Candidatus Micrarchaeaceae archaeon]
MASKKAKAKANRSQTSKLLYAAAVGAAVVAFILFGIYILTNVFRIIPDSFSKVIYAVIIGITVYAIMRLVFKLIEYKLTSVTTLNRSRPIMLLVNIVGYFILALFVLSALGINTSSVLLSGTIIGAVVGLASQNVLANVFGGIMLIFSRPFAVGDEVQISTWQYGVMLTLTPPKYFSKDEIKNGYRGIVKDITLLYTVILDNDGEYVKIPNSIMVQAAVSLESPMRITKVRYEVPKTIPYSRIKAEIGKAVKAAARLSKEPKIVVEETTLSTYLLLISFECERSNEAEAKSNVLQSLISIIEPLKQPTK